MSHKCFLRRYKIKNNWKFDCTCSRCNDKTEFGTFVDAVLCMKCKRLEQERTVVNGTSDALTSIDKEGEQTLDDRIDNKTDVPNGCNLSTEKPFMLPKDPLEYYGQWICNTCDGEVDGFTIYSLVRELQAEVESIKGKVNLNS